MDFVTTMIEPGLLNLFRWYVGIRFALLVAVLIGSRGDNPPTPPHFPEVGIILFGLLLIMLVVPWFERALGTVFLPLAIALATVAPIADAVSTIHNRLAAGYSPNEALSDYWVAFFLLFVPFVLVAWQYRYRWIVVFAVGSTIVDLVAVGGVLATSVEENPAFDLDLTVVGALLLARGLLFLFLGVFIAKLVARQREARVKLQAYAAVVDQMSTERERSRLARELHDTLAHSMTGTAIQLEAAVAVWDDDPADARKLVNRALTGVRDGLAEARRAISDLRASPLEDRGLRGALVWLVDDTAAVSGIDVSLDAPATMPLLDPAVEQVLYRVTEEALTNIARHAEADTATVTLRISRGVVELNVIDNGSGFDAMTVAEGHHGISGMRERAAMVAGSVTVESKIGAGTRIILRVPIGAAPRSGETAPQHGQDADV